MSAAYWGRSADSVFEVPLECLRGHNVAEEPTAWLRNGVSCRLPAGCPGHSWRRYLHTIVHLWNTRINFVGILSVWRVLAGCLKVTRSVLLRVPTMCLRGVRSVFGVPAACWISTACLRGYPQSVWGFKRLLHLVPCVSRKAFGELRSIFRVLERLVPQLLMNTRNVLRESSSAFRWYSKVFSVSLQRVL